jgi:uncharacterized protein (TIGR02217 family)
MTFLEQRFFDDIAPQASSGPEYRTTIKTLRGGAEHRNSLWADPLRSFTVDLTPRDVPSIKLLLDLFADTLGAANAFRVKDWSDFQATRETIGVGNGTLYWFRLTKRYGASYSRRILKPVSGRTAIFLNGVALSPALYAVDTVNGLVIFKTAPGAGVVITANFEFDVPVRFTEDAIQVVMLFYKTGTSDSINLREVRLREVISIPAIDAIRAAIP